MSAQEQQQDFLRQRIEALEKENKRLNKELRKVKERSLKIRLSDPNFNKPLSEIETNVLPLGEVADDSKLIITNKG